jgi:hypothetical protein
VLVRWSLFRPTVAEGGLWVQPVAQDDFDRVYNVPTENVGASWAPLSVRTFVGADQPPREPVSGESAWLGGHALVVRSQARLVLEEAAGEAIELLPLLSDDGDMWLAHATRLVDGLDEEASTVVRFPSTGRIMKVHEFVLRLGAPPPAVFAVPGVRTLLLTEPVVRALESLPLGATRFEPAGYATI